MKPAEIERLAKKIRVGTSEATRQRILADAEAALAKSTEPGSEVSKPGLSIWRTIMKNRIVKLAAAVVVVVVASLAVVSRFAEPQAKKAPRMDAAKTAAEAIVAEPIRGDVILRAKVLEMKYDFSRWEVLKVLYGQPPRARIIVVYNSMMHRELNQPGAERILGLELEDDGTYSPIHSSGYDNIDEAEAEWTKLIEEVTK